MRLAFNLLVVFAFSGCIIVTPGGTGGGSGTGGGVSGSGGGTSGTGGGTAGGGTAGGGNAGGAAGGTAGGAAGGSGGASGDITFLWTFAGATCAAAQVSTVKITMPGQTLANGGIFPCSSSGTDGIVLLSFAPATYTFTLEGRDSGNTVRYQKGGQVTVNGNASVIIDLLSSSQTATTHLTWTFPPNSSSSNPTCAQAGVANVEVTIDATAPYVVSCDEGQTSGGSVTPQLALGNHSITVKATNAQAYEYYNKTRSTVLVQTTPMIFQFDMDWSVGGARVQWNLTNGGSATSCSTAGVTTLYINFRDSQNQLVYAGAGDAQPCSSSYVVYSFLKPGPYAVFIQGTGSGSAAYSSNQASPPTVTVAAGVFPQTGGTNVTVAH